MRYPKGATVALVLALIVSCAEFIGQQTQTPAREGTVQGIVLKEPGKNLLRVQTAAGEGAELAFRLTESTKYLESKDRKLVEVERPHEFAGRAVEVHFRNVEAEEIVLQSACNEYFCPKKKCARKCGANPCVCST